MQNPFKHRPSDDFARRDRDDTRWEARDQQYDEGRSWSEGDGGRTADRYRSQGRDDDYSTGQYDRDASSQRGYGYGQGTQSGYGRGMSTPYTGERARLGSSHDQYGYGSQSDYGRGGAYGQSNSGRSHYGQSGYRGDLNRGGYGGFNASVDRDSGYERTDYGRSTGGDYEAQGYAPGSDIWRDQGSWNDRGRSAQSHHDFEPDYLHWRNQQMSNLDRDYSDWRTERRQKFSSDFDSWRKNRPEVKAENPIVGDVSDGGAGNAEDAKKR